MPQLIYLCSPHPSQAVSLAEQLVFAGRRCERAAGAEALDLLLQEALPDLLVVDMDEQTLRLPVADGVPLLTLGARASEPEDQAEHLEKPFRLADFLRLVETLLRRGDAGAGTHIPLAPGCVFVPSKRLLLRTDSGGEERLTEKEAELLDQLLRAPGVAHTREALLERVWGYAEGVTTHTVETHVYRLRGKLRKLLPDTEMIASLEGGYALQKEQAA